MSRFLSNSEFQGVYRQLSGLMPIDLDAKNRRIGWMDLENYHFYEGFFHKSLNMFTALKEKKSAVETYVTGFDVLENGEIFRDHLEPTGFVFHAGRSGSTLLAKVLARSRKNLVLSEHPAHNRFWTSIAGNGAGKIENSEKNRRLYENLVLATARRRLASHQHCFIKFTSYNIFFYDFIRRAFPKVPAIFLHREPREILSSLDKNPPPWTRVAEAPARSLLSGVSEKDFLSLSEDEYRRKALDNLLSAAEKSAGDLLKRFDYKNLKAENLASILDIFGVRFSEDDLGKMRAQFQYDSKTENKLIEFSR